MAMPGVHRTMSLQACTPSRLVSQHSYPGPVSQYQQPPLYHPSLDANFHAMQPQGDSVLGYSASLNQLPTSVFSKDSQVRLQHSKHSRVTSTGHLALTCQQLLGNHQLCAYWSNSSCPHVSHAR